MKKFLLVLPLLLVSALLAAQDVIVTKSSDKIEAKIIEVNNSEVKYKKANFLDGPTFIISISEISSIIYANGDVTAFNEHDNYESPNRYDYRGGQSKPRPTNYKIRFNPEPITRNRPFGITVGYVSKQLSYNNEKMAWCDARMFYEYGYGYGSPQYKPKKSSSSFKVGLFWTPEFRYGIGIQTGVFYELSTSKYSPAEYEGGLSFSVSEHTLSIPLRLQYRYEIIKDLSIMLYTGPSFDISLSYKLIENSEWDGENTLNLLQDNDIVTYNRFNMLWGVGAGVRWKGIQLTLGGDWGLTDIAKGEDGPRLNKPFQISLSYLF